MQLGSSRRSPAQGEVLIIESKADAGLVNTSSRLAPDYNSSEPPITTGGEFPKELSPEDTKLCLGRLSALLGQESADVAATLRDGDATARDRLTTATRMIVAAEALTRSIASQE